MAKKQVPSSPGQIRIPSAKSEDQPATRKMVYLVRDELKAVRNELKADIRSLEHKVESRFERVEASLTRMEILFEEQNSNNRIVLEGLQSLWQRQDRVEKRLDKNGL